MPVAFVCFYAAAPPSGGAGSVTCALAEALPGERLLVQPGPVEHCFLTPGGLSVWQLRLTGNRGWRKLLGIPGYVRRVVRLMQRAGVEVVVLEGASWVFYHWWLLQRLRRSRVRLTVLYHAHNVEYELRQQRHGLLVRWLTRWAEGRVLRGVTQSFAVSERDRDAFQRLYGVVPLLLPNGVDSRRFAGVTAAASAGLALAALLLAPQIVDVVFGPHWDAVATVLRNLSPALALQPLLASTGWVFISRGEGDRYRRWALGSALIQGLAILAGLPLGIAAVALATSLSTWCLTLPWTLHCLRLASPDLGRAALRAVGVPLLVVVAVLAVALGAGQVP